MPAFLYAFHYTPKTSHQGGYIGEKIKKRYKQTTET